MALNIHTEKHKSKDGCNKQIIFSLDCVSDTDIADAIERGRLEAMKDIKMFGMEQSLDSNVQVENEFGTVVDEDSDDEEKERVSCEDIVIK